MLVPPEITVHTLKRFEVDPSGKLLGPVWHVIFQIDVGAPVLVPFVVSDLEGDVDRDEALRQAKHCLHMFAAELLERTKDWRALDMLE